MAFGLIQWLVSFAIFLVVLTVITWSAVHLGRKERNVTDIVMRFLDLDYPIETKWLSSSIIHNSTTQIVESTESPTLFADDQGSEVPNSAEFYKRLQAIRSTKNTVVNSIEDVTTTTIFTPSVINNDSVITNDSTWSERITTYNSSDAPSTLHSHRNISEEFIKLSWKSDSHQSVGEEFSNYLQDERNKTSNTSVTFSFKRMPSDVKQSSTTQVQTGTQSPHI